MTTPAIPLLRTRWPFLVAAALCLLSMAIVWPGIATYDAVAQYQQVVSGQYDDWHPPIMARLWSLLAGPWPGAAPMLLLQLVSYWLGLGLLAQAVGRGRASSSRTARWSVRWWPRRALSAIIACKVDPSPSPRSAS
ncbi:MAG: hypothetical protein PSY12_09670 [bacterium]|nr:hypothetical protein [bacterium]